MVINETEVEVEDYEKVIGDLGYTTGVGAGQNVDSFEEPIPNKNVRFLGPQDRPTLRTIDTSLDGNQSRFLRSSQYGLEGSPEI